MQRQRLPEVILHWRHFRSGSARIVHCYFAQIASGAKLIGSHCNPRPDNQHIATEHRFRAPPGCRQFLWLMQ
jgi:hypothetical protein